MKVKIGPYRNWIGPYQVADWFKPIFGEERIERFTDGKVFDKLSDWTMPIFTWIDEHKPKRVEKVKIDKWDTWSMDHTLSIIIVPMLLQLRETKHGSPHTDDEDVPEELKSSSAPPKKYDGETDENWHKRWNWIMDEMIWAFTEIRDDKWESQYHTGKMDFIEKEIEIDNKVQYELIESPSRTDIFDKEGYTKHLDRIRNGTRLFGKYYQGGLIMSQTKEEEQKSPRKYTIHDLNKMYPDLGMAYKTNDWGMYYKLLIKYKKQVYK